MELLEAMLKAAVIEARSVPRLVERDGRVYWRTDGRMVLLTADREQIWLTVNLP